MRQFVVMLLVAFMVFNVSTASAQVQRGLGVAVFQPLGDLPGGPFGSSAYGVSADGQTVVGASKAVSGVTGGFDRAFRWTAQTGMTPIGHLGSPQMDGSARSVSADGLAVIGHSGGSFKWTRAQGMTAISGNCGVIDISHDGTVVVGWCESGFGRVAATWTAQHGWNHFGALGLDPIDAFFCGISLDHAVIAGQSMIDDPPFAVEPILWTAQSGLQALGDVPGGSHYAVPLALSADGSTMAGFAIGDIGVDAFRWTSARGLENLESGTPGVTTSQANAVSGDGSIIVGGADFLEGFGFIWDQPHGMRSLQKLLRDRFGIPLPGWSLNGVNDVSDNGLVMVGSGVNSAGLPEAWRIELPFMPIDGDANADLLVNIDDLVQVITGWGPCPLPAQTCPGDLYPDGTVNIDDLVTVITNWDQI